MVKESWCSSDGERDRPLGAILVKALKRVCVRRIAASQMTGA
jgi:hypothetical protein